MLASSRRRCLLALKASVSLGLLGWLGYRMLARDGVEVLAERLTHLHVGWIALAVLLHFAAVFAGVARWRLLLGAARIELPFAWLLRSFLIGRFVGAFTPSTTGLDGWRLYEVGKESGELGKSAAVIAVEKLVGLVGMALVCAALVPLGGTELMGPSALGAAALLGGGALVGLAALGSPRLLAALAGWTPKGRVRALATRLSDGLAECRVSPAQVARAVGLGVTSHLALSWVFVATAYAVGVDASAAALLVTGNAIVLAVLLPVSIGGVGVREGVAVFLLAAAGVASTDAVLIALLGYLTGQVPALLGGGLMALSRPRRDGPVDGDTGDASARASEALGGPVTASSSVA